MIDPEKTIRPVMIGNRYYPRYAIAINCSPFSPRLYWTGTGGACWTADSSRARKWTDYGAAELAGLEVKANEPDPLGGR
jgi:hypothetical protein